MAGKTATMRGSTAIAQEKARRARAKKHAGLTRYVSLDEPIAAIDTAPLKSKAWLPLPGSKPVLLVDLEPNKCKWSVSDNSPYLFCGEPAHEGTYCRIHAQLGYRKIDQPTAARNSKTMERRR